MDMDIALPATPGWSAMHLIEDQDWHQIAVIAKREYDVAGGAATAADDPDGVLMADDFNSAVANIRVESDIALRKTMVDWHFLDLSTGSGPWTGRIDTAALTVNGSVRVSFAKRSSVDPNREVVIDPDNLFGYEPRSDRITLSNSTDPDVIADSFDFDAQTPGLFRSTRRSDGFVAGPSTLPLPQTLDVTVSTTTAGTTTNVMTLGMTVPQLTATAFLYEGGPDKAAFWCRRDPVPMVADTLTLTTTRAAILWRTALSIATHPVADLRMILIEEAA
jgi:hypothetical protein